VTAPRRPPSRTALAGAQQGRQDDSAPVAAPPAPPAPARVPEAVLALEDEEREERLRRMLVLWGSGATEAKVRRVILREFAVTTRVPSTW
jgi:hypothetical protein